MNRVTHLIIINSCIPKWDVCDLGIQKKEKRGAMIELGTDSMPTESSWVKIVK